MQTGEERIRRKKTDQSRKQKKSRLQKLHKVEAEEESNTEVKHKKQMTLEQSRHQEEIH